MRYVVCTVCVSLDWHGQQSKENSLLISIGIPLAIQQQAFEVFLKFPCDDEIGIRILFWMIDVVRED